METKALNATLNRLIGHLVIDAPQEKKNYERLGKSLSRSFLGTDLRPAIKKEFTFEKSDLFFEEKISNDLKKGIASITKNRPKEKDEIQYKVFRREAPIREHLLHNSIADWAIGAKVDHTIGPFKNKDGRQFWYDFFPLEKLVALHMKGETSPILLFKVKQGPQIAARPNANLRIRPAKTYTLSKGSIWILSKFLAPNAPADTYCGLTIKGGTITLGTQPKSIDKKLTITAATMVTVQLNLDQQKVDDADETSPYGIDAREMIVRLPDLLTFHFSGNGRRIDAVGGTNWALYGQKIAFQWNESAQTVYDAQLQRVIFPFSTQESHLDILQCESDFNELTGRAPIDRVGWVLPVANVDTSQPIAAQGTGQIFVQCKEGLSTVWKRLAGGGLALAAPGFVIGPGQIFLLDFLAGNVHARQSLELWKDEVNPFGTKVNLSFSDQTPFYYASSANGNELLSALTNADFQIDRPVRVNGEPPAVQSLNSLLLIAASATNRLIYLLDDNLIADDANLNNEDPIIPDRIALALTNALFKVEQPNGCLLFGSLSEDFKKVEKGFLFLTFGLLAYIPTLPDPYAANLKFAPRQLCREDLNISFDFISPENRQRTGWLVCRIAWDVPSDETKNDSVEVSFHFAGLNNQFSGISFDEIEEEPEDADPNTPTLSENTLLGPGVELSENTDQPRSNVIARNSNRPATRAAAAASSATKPLPDFDCDWERQTFRHRRDLFALLDVSTNADLFGVSFDLRVRRNFRSTTNVDPTTGEAVANLLPIQVEGMDVVSTGSNVKAFTVPQISWEPVINLTPPGTTIGNPDAGFNYYPNDGGPTRILNESRDNVKLAPLDLVAFLEENRNTKDDFQAYSLFTLPFGLKAAALLQKKYTYENVGRDGGDLNIDSVDFGNDVKTGLQLRMDAGVPLREGDSKMFMGSTVQINNILNVVGNPTGNSTLGRDVTEIFNGEFWHTQPNGFELFKQRGVPVTRMDLSGYGASMFSNWFNTKAAVAEVSQAKFDIFVGRCGHEVIQVKSIMYPWAIKVVRTITLFRKGSGFVYRFDSGWRPESDGKFDFRYYIFKDNPNFPGGTPENPEPQLISEERFMEYGIHPGVVKALYNVGNIVETDEIKGFTDAKIEILNGEKYVDEVGKERTHAGAPISFDVNLQPVYFDADIEISDVTAGFEKKNTSDGEKNVVPSKRIVGFVQLGPKGMPLDDKTLRELVQRQGNIGGAIDCEVNLANSNQKMRLNHFDFNNSFGDDGVSTIFSVAGRGNVLLPKDGSWSMVKHERQNGAVSPVPTNLSIPVIKEGRIVKDGDTVKVAVPPGGGLTRLADPLDLLRQPTGNTINYGFLQNTDTQKALFLTPAFKTGTKKLLSRTPPLFADAFRIVNSKGIFPNIGDADDFSGATVGEVIPLKEGNTIPFDISDLQDLGKDVFELMDIQDTIQGAKQQGLNLLHNPEQAFTLPSEFVLVDMGDGNFKIYIEYDDKDKNGGVNSPGELNFDIDSVAESWKSKMSNIGVVMDLGGIERLMTIKGKWDSENGKEASYPEPELVFSDELQPVIDILQILQQLQGGDYAGAVAQGLKLAMSNKAGSWEYKFEASKEIPVLRFPVPDALYNDPNTPFKLECGLTLRAYFNAALKVTNDANELLPSAGGSLGFYGRLSVMCVSLSAATVYALGQVNLDIAADTKIGPSLQMKFGFGAQLVVGLPVAGNVSVLFVVGIELFISENLLEVSAFMLFEGHAEILGGLVGITIRIEAKGTYSRKSIGGGQRTDMACQVTFGLDISIAFIINISFTKSWQEQRQIA